MEGTGRRQAVFFFFGAVASTCGTGDFTELGVVGDTGRKCVYALAAEQPRVGSSWW
jgi:hypothetical protein